MMTTAFNGASNIVQSGGLSILDEQGLGEIQALIDYYLANAKKLRETVTALGYKVSERAGRTTTSTGRAGRLAGEPRG